VTNDWDPETLFDVLGSEEVRRILALADREPTSAGELADRLDVSQPTVYRRLDACEAYDLVERGTTIDDEGNHYQVYETNLERLCYVVDDGGFDVHVELRQDVVDGDDGG